MAHTPDGMKRSEYYLTDSVMGDTIAESRLMTPDEFEVAQALAEEATDGNWWWVPAFQLDQRVLQGGGYGFQPDGHLKALRAAEAQNA